MKNLLNSIRLSDLRLLSLSTAEQGCSLAVIDETNLVCEEYWSSKQTHSKRLVNMIEHMLVHRANMKLDDIDVFVAAKGPGSFTGLRIGISVTQGLAYALGKPSIGVSSLDGIAFGHVHSSIPVCVMMDARRNEVYSAQYKFEAGCLVSKTQEKVLSPLDAVTKEESPVLYVGSGSKVYKTMIEQEADCPVFGDDFSNFVSANALVRTLFAKGNFLESSENILVPSYIRKSDAELQFVQ